LSSIVRPLGAGADNKDTAPYVGDMSAAQKERMRPAFCAGERMDFCRPSAARAANGLALLPLLRQQLSMGLGGGAVDHHERRSSHSTRAAKIFCHNPRLLQRLKRLNTVAYGRYSSGSARQRQLAQAIEDGR
jgi:hypothetical protein